MGENRDDHANRPADEAEIVRMFTMSTKQGAGRMRFILGPCAGVSVYYAPNQQAFMGHIPLASQPTGRQLLEEVISKAQRVIGEQGAGARVWVGGAMNSPTNNINTTADREAVLELVRERLPGASLTVQWQDEPDCFTDYTLDVATGQEIIEEGPAEID